MQRSSSSPSGWRTAFRGSADIALLEHRRLTPRSCHRRRAAGAVQACQSVSSEALLSRSSCRVEVWNDPLPLTPLPPPMPRAVMLAHSRSSSSSFIWTLRSLPACRAGIPDGALVIEPAADRGQRFRPDGTCADAPILCTGDQARLLLTSRWRMTGQAEPVGPARSLTLAGPSINRVRIDRRVGSAKAGRSARDRCSCWLMMRTIDPPQQEAR